MWLLQSEPRRMTVESSLGCSSFAGFAETVVFPRNLPGNSICENEPHIPVSGASSALWAPVTPGCSWWPSADPASRGSSARGELWLFSPQCSEPQKLLHIAQELLHTEETYVRRLHLLDQVATWLGPTSVHFQSLSDELPLQRWLGLAVGV